MIKIRLIKNFLDFWRLTPSHFLVLAILFTSVYLKVAEINSVATTALLATFDADPPFKFRFILPLIFSSFLSPHQLDSKPLHFIVTIIAVILIFSQQQKFAKRLYSPTQSAPHITATSLALFSILMAHYCTPRSLNFYYIYDIPAILFYFYTFNTITSSKTIPIYSILIIIIGFLNRETLIVAILHATSFNWHHLENKIFKKRLFLSVVIISIFGIIRLIETNLLGNDISENASMTEGNKIRFIANLWHLKHDGNYRIQLLLFGCGALFWIPIVYKKLNPTLKSMCLSTIPALSILLWTGNFTELRIYNELVPLLGVLFSFYVSQNNIVTPCTQRLRS